MDYKIKHKTGEIKDHSGLVSATLKQTYSKEQLFEFTMYCSGHSKHMIEFMFEEFHNKKLTK